MNFGGIVAVGATVGCLTTSASAVVSLGEGSAQPIIQSVKALSAPPVFEGLIKDVADARELSDIVYYRQLSGPIGRGIRTNEQQELELFQFRSLKFTKRVYQQGPNGKTVVVYERPDRTPEQKRQATEIYDRVIRQLAVDRSEGKHTGAPIEFLGILPPPVSKLRPETINTLARIGEKYNAEPSDMAAVAYVELVLVLRELGDQARYREVIAEGIHTLDLDEIDFRSDALLRVDLVESFNFARPEACLLFLAAEDARLSGRAAEAQRYYETLIERAPASPFAWEAAAGLVGLPDAEPKQIEHSINRLLATYPLVWGCPRPALKLGREAFAALVPGLLRQVPEAAREIQEQVNPEREP